MKLKKYMPFVALAAILAGCSEDPELPPVKGPESSWTENTSILELKQEYWQTSANYVSTVGLTSDGDSVIIKGTVISSDQSGNIYKSLMIYDGTAALTVAVNAYDLYQTYQYGQTVYINATGLHIGGYNSLMQLGGEGTYNGAPSMTFMTEDEMTSHAQQDGWAADANVDALIADTDIPTLTAAKSSAEGLQTWQSRLVRLTGVSFEDAGQQFAPTATTNRYLKDEAGNRINLRCSSYSDWATEEIPAGSGTVTAILSYYGSDWQLMLSDIDGLSGFENTDPEPPAELDGQGTKDAPYSVADLLALNNPETTKQWATGVIVGCMNYTDGVGNVFSATELTTNTNIVIAATATGYDEADIVAVQLPAGDLRTSLNLVDHPEMLGKEVTLCGDLQRYCNIVGIRNTVAAVVDGTLIGTEPSDEPSAESQTYSQASSLTSGIAYVFYTDNTVSKVFGRTSGYDYLDVTEGVSLAANGTLTASTTDAFTFTETAKGWTIQDSNGTYLYMDNVDTHNSFQLSQSLDESGDFYYWTIEFQADGRVKITNNGIAKTIQYAANFTSYGCYSDSRGVYPYLYQPAN